MATDGGIDFAELDRLALATCKRLWEQEPNALRWEYCGFFFQAGDRILASQPETLQRPSECLPTGFPDSGIRASWHSHRWTPEPSFWDQKIAQEYPELGHYLCSPSGIVRRFSAEEGMVIGR